MWARATIMRPGSEFVCWEKNRPARDAPALLDAQAGLNQQWAELVAVLR